MSRTEVQADGYEAGALTDDRAAKPQRADARRNRERILEAAIATFSRSGLGAQMDEIAAGAQVGVGTLYRHFPTKEALVDALMERRFAQIAEHARSLLDRPDPGAAVKDLMRGGAFAQREDRAFADIIAVHPQIVRQHANSGELAELTTALIARAHSAGEIRADFTREDLQAVMCALGAVAAHMPAGMQERVLELILDALEPRTDQRDAPTRP